MIHQKITLISQVTGGKLNDYARKVILDALQRMEGKKVEVTIAEYRKKRSNNENRFYFGVVLPMVKAYLMESGDNLDLEETHEFIVRHIWKHTKIIQRDGEVMEVRLSSTRLSTTEWEQMIELTRVWAAHHGFDIPYPQELTMLAG